MELNYEIVRLKISDLLLSIDNPRFDPVSNQQEAIKTIIKDQGDKLIGLIKDILKEGLNPSDLPIVTPDYENDDRFIVLEGNRRITALKILNQPALIPSEFSSLSKKIEELKRQFPNVSLTELDCVSFEDQEDALHWIEIKHTGEGKGEGTVKWDSRAVQRFNVQRGRTSYSIQVIDYLIKYSGVENYEEVFSSKFSITNLDRLLKDPYVRDFLGIDVSNGYLITNLHPSEINKTLMKIVSDVKNEITVNHIKHKGDRIDYLASFHAWELPDLEHRVDKPWLLQDGYTEPADNGSGNPSGNAGGSGNPGGGAGGKRNNPHSNKRKYLIPSTFVVKIHEKRINNIYLELRKLNVDDFPNAVAVSFRVFIELSVDAFIDKVSLTSVNKNSKLVQKIQAVTKYLEDNNILTKYELKPVKTAVSNSNSILSTETLNAYVHNGNMQPLATDLKTTWDNLSPFIRAIFS